MGIISKKRKKKKANKGMFEKITVNGNVLPVLNFFLYNDSKSGDRYIELASKNEIPDLHFSEIQMDIFLTSKQLHLNVTFFDAYADGKFKIYKFKVESLKEYFR